MYYGCIYIRDPSHQIRSAFPRITTEVSVELTWHDASLNRPTSRVRLFPKSIVNCSDDGKVDCLTVIRVRANMPSVKAWFHFWAWSSLYLRDYGVL